MKKLIALVFALVLATVETLCAQGTSFTYQGRLNSVGAPVNGNYDLRFALYDAGTNGNRIGNALTNIALPVSNGFFDVTLDFGGVFTGTNYWLDISVRTNGVSPFTALTPRQPITPTPYAVYAATAGNALIANSALSVPATNISGIIPLTQLPAGAFSTITTNGSLITVTSVPNPDPYTAVSFNSNPNTTPYTRPPLLVNGWGDASNSQGTETGAGFPVSSFLTEIVSLRNSPLFNLGFNTVVIDGGWLGYRDASGFIHENAQEWPDGISNCVRYAHSLGIKVGIWHSTSLTTSNGLGIQQGFAPASGGHWTGNTNALQLTTPGFSNDQLIVNDASTFAHWGIDYVKLELGTNSILSDVQQQHAVQLFASTGLALGHPFYIMSAVGTEGGQPWMKGLINAQRSGAYDVPNWTAGIDFIFQQFTNNFFFAAALAPFSGPGTYCSTDILPDNTPIAFENTVMTMAAMLSSELCVGNATRWNVFNRNLIDIDQDSLAIAAFPIATNGSLTVWQKPLSQPGSFAVMFLNIGSGNASFTVTNLSLFNTMQTQMLGLDLTSNITTMVSNNWTIIVPPQTAYGFKLMPLINLASATYILPGNGPSKGAATIALANQSTSRSSTLVYSNTTGAAVHVTLYLDAEITAAATGSLALQFAATNNSSGPYTWAPGAISTATTGYTPFTPMTFVLSNNTALTYTATLTGSGKYNLNGNLTWWQ